MQHLSVIKINLIFKTNKQPPPPPSHEVVGFLWHKWRDWDPKRTRGRREGDAFSGEGSGQEARTSNLRSDSIFTE